MAHYRRPTLPPVMRAYIKELKPICEYCKERPSTDIHHADCDPRNNSVANLQALCEQCHHSKGALPERSPFKVLLTKLGKKLRTHQEEQRLEGVFKSFMSERCPANCVCIQKQFILEYTGEKQPRKRVRTKTI